METESLYQQIILEPDASAQENANVDGRTPLAKLNRIASVVSKEMMHEQLLTPEIKEALDEQLIYIHDADYYVTGTTTCAQIPLARLLKDGFHTGHGSIRPPQDIRAALALASIIVQANQNMQHGGQAYATFDHDLAPYVEKTFLREKEKLERLPYAWSEAELESYALKETSRITDQACEAFIHNANSMHSRGGGQVPFVSINYGTDSSKFGRMLIRSLLLATEAGLGKGETPIFPIQIFKVKNGMNFLPEDPNYDLFKLATRVTGKRLFPNFSFLDAPFNRATDDDPDSEVAYMGCRTRVFSNRHGRSSALGRGNLSFTTVNLVRLALLAEDEFDFLERLEQTTRLACTQLYERYLYQAERTAGEFPFLYRHVWRDGGKLASTDPVKDVLRHGTLAVGFIGLAEALKVLTGFHHGESDVAHETGIAWVQLMRRVVEQYGHVMKMNYSLIATPAEGLSGKFVPFDRERFGLIPFVTDKSYYTNSFHVPVSSRLTIRDKIRREAPFHAICDGGHITYVEVDGALAANPEAIEDIVRLMFDAGIGYGSINHPVDRCLDCATEQTIESVCPVCGGQEIERIRRITGYLVGTMDRWNEAKRMEERDRVTHDAASVTHP